MMKKPMGKKAAWIVFAGIVVAAVLLGLLLLNKGDGPVAGMILSDSAIDTTDAYSAAEKNRGDGVYLVVSNAFNEYQADYSAGIPEGGALYANLHCVECAKGTAFTCQWLRDGASVAEESVSLTTEPQGVITSRLDGEAALSGSYTLEVYNGDNLIFEYSFEIE